MSRKDAKSYMQGSVIVFFAISVFLLGQNINDDFGGGVAVVSRLSCYLVCLFLLALADDYFSEPNFRRRYFGSDKNF